MSNYLSKKFQWRDAPEHEKNPVQWCKKCGAYKRKHTKHTKSK